MKNLNKKNIYIAIAIAIGIVALFAIILILKKEYVIAVDEIPSKGLLKTGTSEIQLITKPLLYTPLIKLKDDNSYELLTAKKVEIVDNKVIVELKNEKTAQMVLESYKEALSQGFDENTFGENIVGGRDFIYGENKDLKGISVDKNVVTFEVNDSKDLRFLTIPLTNDLSKWKIKEISDKHLVIRKGLTTIKFELMENITNNKFDMYVTKIPDIELPDYSKIELTRHSNYIGLVNYEEQELNELKDLLDNKIVSSSIEEVAFWNDPSYNGAIVNSDLQNKLGTAGIKVNTDYCQQTYLYKLMNGQSKFIFFYDGDYLDKETFKIFDNFEYYEIKGADSFIYYNKKTKNLLNLLKIL